MFFLRYPAAFLCFVLFASGAVSGEYVKKAVGDQVSFRPQSAIPNGASIIWKQVVGKDVIKAIEFDEDGKNTPNPRFEHITTLDETTGEITIKDLKLAHSGVYTIDINSKEQEQKFTLNVMERVVKPNIEVETTVNPDVMILTCKYKDKIKWNNSDGETLQGSPHEVIGQLIKVDKGNPEKYYMCTLYNDVSEESSKPVYERDIFKDEGPQWIPPVIICLVIAAILVILVVLFRVYTPFHDWVLKVLRNTPCIRGKKDDGNVAMEEERLNHLENQGSGKKDEQEVPKEAAQ